MTVPRRQSSHHRPGRSVMLPAVFGHVSLYLHRAQTPEKNNKTALQCARCLTKLKTAGSMLTYAHIPSPHWRQRRKSHHDAVEITLKKLASVASIRLRGKVTAANRKTRHNNTVMSRHYDRRAIFVPGDVKFQDGDAFDLSKLGGGGGAFFHFYFVLSMFYLR